MFFEWSWNKLGTQKHNALHACIYIYVCVVYGGLIRAVSEDFERIPYG